MLQEHFSICTALGNLTGQVAVVLLGVDILDDTLLGLEVESHLSRLVSITTHIKYRRADGLVRGRIHPGVGMYQITVETHVDMIRREIHVLVFHL